MNERKPLLMLAWPYAVARQSVATIVILAAALGCMNVPAADNPPIAECAGTSLFDLIDSANYSKSDKETLKTGLAVAIPGATTSDAVVSPVTQETIDIQVKNGPRDFTAALGLAFGVSKKMDEKISEFIGGEAFQRIPSTDREVVAAYLREVVDTYRGQTLETLFNHHGCKISIPENVTRSVANAEYRTLLVLAAQTYPKHEPSKVQAARPTAPGERTYALKAGDSLAYVARIHKVSPAAIVTANPGLVPTGMNVGQVLIIPSPVPAAPAAVVRKPELVKGPDLSSTR